jgi:predicted DNA-binding ribbon-helix-helix protein
MFRGMKQFGSGLSINKLANMMVDVLLRLPKGSTNLKEVCVDNLGFIGAMTTARDVNAAWDQAKKIAARNYPSFFILDNRSALQWNDDSVTILDKKISTANYKKLNELAEKESCSVNEMVARLVRNYQKQSRQDKT